MRIPECSARQVIRGLAAALLFLLLGCVSHVSAGGRLPGPGRLAVMFAVLAAVGVGLTRARRGFDVQVLVLGVAQLVLHFAFHTAGTAAAEAPAMPSGRAHHHGGMVSGVVPGAGGHREMSVGMTLGHGAAALGVAVCLAYGDRLVRRLAALAAPRIRFLRLSPIPPAPPRLLPRGPRVLAARYGVLLARGRHRRGPPLPLPA
ncbi:hypothetical protein [Streptomyces halobius]|uniref:MFS transporter n=1 Tax=Streptomyces halobius TaxID=2879846 RepID=A0ABY4MBS2_9ACTN|nr:hypothetical protein [Streptomyces halobius]UQA95225.1 hypothetical protein K9S39_28240 [Streptomyces halobius]